MIELEKAQEFFKSKNFVVSEKKLKQVLAAQAEGLPILAVGPTGCGKTHFFQLLSEFLGGEYFYQSLNGSIAIQDLTQERIIGKDGTFEEHDMVLAKWLRADKGLLQLDEVNSARPETLMALHPVLDLKAQLDLPYSGESLPVTQDHFLVMSCNEGDEYSGTNVMNMAFQNRYVKIYFTYIRGEPLASMLVKKTKVDLPMAREVVECWEKYQSSKDVEQPTVSIRMLEYWCRLSKHLGLKEAGEVTFAGLVANNEEELVEITQGDFFVNLSG